MRELVAFQQQCEAEDEAKEAAEKAAAEEEAERIRSILKENLVKNGGKPMRAAEKQKLRLACRSSSRAAAQHHQEPWMLEALAAQQAIAGATSRRLGEHGPEGPGFTRLPMV